MDFNNEFIYYLKGLINQLNADDFFNSSQATLHNFDEMLKGPHPVVKVLSPQNTFLMILGSL